MALVQNARLGHTADVYLLGATLFEILTGVPPHPGATLAECLHNAANNVFSPSGGGDTGLVSIAMKAMAGDPAARYGTVGEFRQALHDWSADRRCRVLCGEGEKVLTRALKQNKYDIFMKASALFEQALELAPGNPAAKAGALKTGLAYGRAALANSEHDLALSIITPFIGDDDEAALLAERVGTAKKKTVWRRRRNAFITVAAVLLVVCGGAAAYMFYHVNRSKFDEMAKTAQQYDESERHRKEHRIYGTIYTTVRQLAQELALQHLKINVDDDAYLKMDKLFFRREQDFKIPDINDSERFRIACWKVYEDLPEYIALRDDIARHGIKARRRDSKNINTAIFKEADSAMLNHLDVLIEHLHAFAEMERKAGR